MVRSPCCEKTGLKKGPWTSDEDQKLIEYIHKNGYGNWRTLPKNAGLQRCGKSCRLRWTNYLRPDIKRGKFSVQEEEAIIQLHSILGNKWSAIAGQLPGRTDNEIKNYWNTHIRKKLMRMGIDPVTHRPRLDLFELSNVLTSSSYGNPQIDFNSRLLGFHHHPSLITNPQLLRSLTTCLLNSPQLQHATNDGVLLPKSDLLPTSLNSCTPNFAPNLNQIDDTDQVCHFSQNQIGGGAGGAVMDELLGCVYDGAGRAGVEPGSSTEGGSGFEYCGYTWQSGLSTPNSSNSNYNVNSCNEEKQRESIYCSGSIKFEVPDLLDISEFIM